MSHRARLRRRGRLAGTVIAVATLALGVLVGLILASGNTQTHDAVTGYTGGGNPYRSTCANGHGCHADPGSNDYPWQPLCTYRDCGPYSLPCDKTAGQCADPWGMAYGQCVSFVAWKVYELHGGTQRPDAAQGKRSQNWRPGDPGINDDPVTASWGNAANWAKAAADAGLSVTHRPAVGDVAQWNANSHGMDSAGHVMMVVAVSPHNYITVAGYNTHLDGGYAEWKISWRDYNWGSTSNDYGSAPPWPDNFLVIK